MTLFNYKAVDPDGSTVRGSIDALNLVDLERRLEKMGLDLVTASATRLGLLPMGRSVPRRELIHFCFHLEKLLRAGVPILEGLSDLRDSLEHRRFRAIIASLTEAIEGGQTLSQAMNGQPRAFDGVFVSLIHAGETSGRLPEVLGHLTESLKWRDELASQTKKLAMYPAFVGSLVIAATFTLMLYMVPQLKLFVKNMGHALPWQTRALFMVSDLLVAYWHIALLLPLLLAAAARVLLHATPHLRPHVDELKLRLPFIGILLRKIIIARFANTFAMLYSSGVPILQAIRTTQDGAGNLEIRRGLERVEQLVMEGQNITTAFHHTRLFPPLVIRMLRVGENTGTLDEALANVSYFYNRDIKESVEKAQQLIEPVLTLLLGCLLGWIMLAVLGPVYDIISAIRT
ncbi:type II secretion system F family protein [Propionivibrio limicola]|uniref:type II secretion system F family protein n=1 Tax=Propionivibrio limicola TaxID=167645 RepID=UPI001290A23D|nr:type II secretion system F family protein [Propionivibrio limicola]